MSFKFRWPFEIHHHHHYHHHVTVNIPELEKMTEEIVNMRAEIQQLLDGNAYVGSVLVELKEKVDALVARVAELEGDSAELAALKAELAEMSQTLDTATNALVGGAQAVDPTPPASPEEPAPETPAEPTPEVPAEPEAPAPAEGEEGGGEGENEGQPAP